MLGYCHTVIPILKPKDKPHDTIVYCSLGSLPARPAIREVLRTGGGGDLTAAIGGGRGMGGLDPPPVDQMVHVYIPVIANTKTSV